MSERPSDHSLLLGLLEELVEPVEAALDRLAAGGVGHPYKALGPEGGPGHEVDMGRLQRGHAEARRIRDRLAAQRAPEMARYIEECIKRAVRHERAHSLYPRQPGAHHVTPHQELAPHLLD